MDSVAAVNYSVLNHEDELYYLLPGKIFRHYDGNIQKSIAVAIHLTGEGYPLAFVKIAEYDNELLKESSEIEAKHHLSARLTHHMKDSIHKRPLFRQDSINYSTKIYEFQLFKGIDTISQFIDNQYTTSEMLYLSIQYMLQTYSLREKNIVHRDIKPEHYVTRKENGKLIVSIIDFYNAKEMTQKTTSGEPFFEDTHLIGSLAYFPASIKYASQEKRAVYYTPATDLFNAAKSTKLLLNQLIQSYSSELTSEEYSLLEKIKELVDCIVNSPVFFASHKFPPVLSDDERIKQALLELEAEASLMLENTWMDDSAASGGTDPEDITPEIADSPEKQPETKIMSSGIASTVAFFPKQLTNIPSENSAFMDYETYKATKPRRKT